MARFLAIAAILIFLGTSAIAGLSCANTLLHGGCDHGLNAGGFSCTNR